MTDQSSLETVRDAAERMKIDLLDSGNHGCMLPAYEVLDNFIIDGHVNLLSLARAALGVAQRPAEYSDIVVKAIAEYDEWMLDDDYDGMSKLHEIMGRMRARLNLAQMGETESQAKEPEASGGLCAAASHAVRVGEASADLPATSESMDVTAGETAPSLSQSSTDREGKSHG